MRSVLKILAFAAVGWGIGWGWGWIKGALIASDPAAGKSLEGATAAIWTVALLVGCGALGGLGRAGRLGGFCLGVLATLACVAGNLSHDYQRWLSTQLPNTPAILTSPLAWWAQDSNDLIDVKTGGRRRPVEEKSWPRWAIVSMNGTIAMLIVSVGLAGAHSEDED